MSSQHRPAAPPDVIAAGLRTASAPLIWKTVVLLAAALAGSVLAAAHYRSQAAALRSAAARVHGGACPVALFATIAVLPSAGQLAGEITAVAVGPSSGQVQVIVTARITGGLRISGTSCPAATARAAPPIAPGPPEAPARAAQPT